MAHAKNRIARLRLDRLRRSCDVQHSHPKSQTNRAFQETVVFEGKMNSQTFWCFIVELMSRCEGKIFLIPDNAAYHTSSETILHLSKNRDRLEFFLPKYAPELNPA